MDYLIVAATEMEISATLRHLDAGWNSPAPRRFQKGTTTIDFCITGVGMVATTYAVTKALAQHHYDLVLQAGVGGAFDRSLHLGDMVWVTTEQFGDLGAQDHDNNINLFEMGLLDKNAFPFEEGKLPTPISDAHHNILLPQVSGLTVNLVTGNSASVIHRAEKYECQVESMEGAAFHYVCLQEQVPFAHVRSLSNYVEPRDKSKWKMKEAVIALNKWLIDFLEVL